MAGPPPTRAPVKEVNIRDGAHVDSVDGINLATLECVGQHLEVFMTTHEIRKLQHA